MKANQLTTMVRAKMERRDLKRRKYKGKKSKTRKTSEPTLILAGATEDALQSLHCFQDGTHNMASNGAQNPTNSNESFLGLL